MEGDLPRTRAEPLRASDRHSFHQTERSPAMADHYRCEKCGHTSSKPGECCGTQMKKGVVAPREGSRGRALPAATDESRPPDGPVAMAQGVIHSLGGTVPFGVLRCSQPRAFIHALKRAVGLRFFGSS